METDSLNSEDRIFLKALFISRKQIDIYEIHKKFLLSPGQVSRTLRKLCELELTIVDIDKGIVKLTDNGLKEMFLRRKEFFGRTTVKYWRKVPEEMTGVKIEINTPFIPKVLK